MSDKLKGVWLDGGVWECEDLSLIEKHLIQKIKDLDNDKGCTAMNAWFSDFLGVSKSRISQLVTSLKKKKLISIKLKFKGKEVTGRVIRILKGGIELFKEGHLEINRPHEYIKDPSLISSEESNISLRNIIKEYKESEKAHTQEIELLKSELETLKSKLDLKAKKGKEEKSCAKKEVFLDAEEIEQIGNGEFTDSGKGLHEFPDITAKKSYKFEKGFTGDVPPTAETTQIKNWEIAVKSYTFPESWGMDLMDAFNDYCEYQDEKTKGRFGQTNVKAIIRKINQFLAKYKPDDISEVLHLAIENPQWANFDPQWVIDRRVKKQQYEQKQAANNNESIYKVFDDQLINYGNQDGHESDNGTIDVEFTEG